MADLQRLIEDELRRLEASELVAKNRRKNAGIDELHVNSATASTPPAVARHVKDSGR